MNNQWNFCPSMNEKKGSLAGAMLDSKIFAIGGGNGAECFSDVEMYDVNVGSWIPTQSLLEKVISSTQFTDGFYSFLNLIIYLWPCPVIIETSNFRIFF